MKVKLVLLFQFIAFATLCLAQAPVTEPDRKDAPVPTVTFEFNWREFDPQWYRVTVESTGRASYESQPQLGPGEVAGDPFMYKFTASEATRKRIFELAKALDYFKGNFEYKGKVASTGTKTLTYMDGDRRTQTTVNWSQNQQMTELVSIFQDMSNTFEYARKLQFTMRFDKLGLDADLKAMELASKRGSLREVQAIEPLLQQIANDHGIMNITRQRALNILGKK